MKRALLLLLVSLSAATASAIELYEEIRVGYTNDVGIAAGLRLAELSEEIPLFFSLNGGYIRQAEPGNAEDARGIFINDGTGGNIEEYGQSWHYGLDVGYEVLRQDALRVAAFGGARQNHYSASFAFIGDNEAFRVTTRQIGFGGGANLILGAASQRVQFALSGGAYYFVKARFDAHGTFYYTPDGVDSQPRDEYTYEDADDAVNQPRLRPFAEIGILLRLGD